jgi:hypothetical protein
MTNHELARLLESDRMARFWEAVAVIEQRHKGPLRRTKDPAWFVVDDVFEDLRAIPRRLLEEKTIDAENKPQ